MTDRLVPLSPTPNSATGAGTQNHSKAVKEDGRRFDSLLSESDAGHDADSEIGGAPERQARSDSMRSHGNNDDDGGNEFSAGMDRPFGGELRPSVTPASPANETALAELSEDIGLAYEQGRYADARQSIDAFLAAHPEIVAGVSPGAVNGGSPSVHPLQVMSEILQFAEQMHDAVAANDFGRARMIASVSARSINVLITGGSELLLPDTANELSTHFVQILRAMPTESTYWEPLAAGDQDQFVDAIQQTADEFAEINPRLQVLFNDHATVAEAGPDMGTFGNVTELAAGELIEQLDAWQAGTLQRPVAMAAIEEIIDQIGSGSERSASEINGFITELAEQGKLETLFQLYGEDRAVLIDRLASKGAEAVVNDPWYEQAMIGVWNESGSDVPGRIEDAMRLSLSNGTQSMTRNMARDVFLAAGGPNGVLGTVAASEVQSAQQSLVDTVTTNSNRFNSALELARENGTVDELMLTLNRRGILNLARAFTDPKYFPLITGEAPAAATPPPALSLEGLSDEAAVAVVNEMKALIETVKASSTAFSTAVANAKAANAGSESSAWATTPDRALLQSARELDKSLAALQPYRDIIGDKNPESWQKLQDLGATASKVASAQISAAHQEIRVQRLTGDATSQQQEVRDTKLEFQQAIAYAKSVGTADGADSLQKRRAIVKVFQAANEYQGALEGLRPLIRNSNDAVSIDTQIRQISSFATDWNEKYQAELLQQGLAIQDGDRVGDGFRIKQQALAALQPLAQDPAAFSAVIEQTYGQAVDSAKIESLRQKVLAGDMSWMPSIEFVGQETLNGAIGAYDGEIIYLQQELLNDPSAAVATFLEESGHALDNYFNGAPSAGGVDTAGDEGELFRRLVSGEALTAEQIAAIRNENDHGVITIDGREIEVEFWNPFKAIVNLVEDVVDTVVDVVEDVVDTVVDVVEDVVDSVVDVVEEVGDIVVDVVEGVGDVAEVAWDLTVDVVEGVVDIGEEIVDFTVDVVEEVIEFGEEIVEFHLDIIEDVVEFHLDVLEDAWDFIEEEVLQSEWFPVVLMVASFVPGLNVVASIGRAVYAGYNTYQGIENGNWAQAAMGLVSLSGAFQDMGFSNEFVTAVGEVGAAVQTGLTVQELIETGDINALLDLAGQYLPEGSVGQQWVDRLQVGSAAYDAAERGDLLGAVGLGAGLLEDLSPDGTGFDSTLAQISDTALDGQALQNLIEDGDYGLAAQLINDNYGELLSLNSETGDNLVQLGEVLTHLEDAKHLIDDQDYLAAAQLLTNTASQHVGSPETQALLQSTASALGQAGEGVAALESGDYNAALASFNQALGMPLDNETQAFLMQAGETAQRAQQIQQIFEDGNYFEAASLAATLGSSLSNNPDLQEHFNATAEVLMRAEGINDAIDSGDYLAAAALASELGASVVGNPNLQSHLENTADVLSQAQSIDAAWQQGDYALAAQIAARLAGEVIDNPALQSHLNNAADVLDRASGINDAIETGDYAAAAALSAELNAATINNPALNSFFEKTSSLLGRAQGIHEAVESGDYERAAELAIELADEARDLPVFREHFEGVADNLNEVQAVADNGGVDSAGAAAMASNTWVDPEELFDDDSRLTAAVDDTIALLDGWAFNPAERQVLDILESIPESRFEEFMSQLESRGYKDTLFDSIDGAEHQQLQEIIADKTGTATSGDEPDGALFGVDAQGNYIDLTSFRETPALVADAGSVTALDAGGQTMTDFDIKPMASYTSAMQAVMSAEGLSMGERYDMLVDTTKFYMTLWAQDSQDAIAASEADNQQYWINESELDPNLNRAAALLGRVAHNLGQGVVDFQSMLFDEDFGRAAGGALADLVTNPAGAAASFMDGAGAFSDLPLDQQIETGLEVALTAVVPSGGLSVGSRLPTPSAMSTRALDAFDGNTMAAALTGSIRITDDAVYIPKASSTLHASVGVPAIDGSVIKITRLSTVRVNEINMANYRDPMTNDLVPSGDTPMSVDHVVPVKEITSLEGFDRLNKQQMESLIQDKGDVPGGLIGNLMPLPASMNSSKKNLTATEWADQGYRGQALDADYVRWLAETRTEILDAARAKIAEYLNQ